MPKKRNLKTLKGKVWALCSQYIRQKFADNNGNCECYTCGTVKPWKELQAGHGVSGRTNGILFLEEIIRPQCVACNMFKGGMYEVFVPKLIDEYTREGYEEFVRMKNTPVKFTHSELDDMAEDYKARIKELETHSN